MKVLYFAYAQMMQRGKPFNARVRGEIREKGHNDAAAKFGGQYRGSLVYGQVRQITQHQLAHLVKQEGSEYKLIQVTTSAGVQVSTFEYVKQDFDDLPIIDDGRFKGPKLG